jgi:hypothetical protein
VPAAAAAAADWARPARPGLVNHWPTLSGRMPPALGAAACAPPSAAGGVVVGDKLSGCLVAIRMQMSTSNALSAVIAATGASGSAVSCSWLPASAQVPPCAAAAAAGAAAMLSRASTWSNPLACSSLQSQHQAAAASSSSREGCELPLPHTTT